MEPIIRVCLKNDRKIKNESEGDTTGPPVLVIYKSYLNEEEEMWVGMPMWIQFEKEQYSYISFPLAAIPMILSNFTSL